MSTGRPPAPDVDQDEGALVGTGHALDGHGDTGGGLVVREAVHVHAGLGARLGVGARVSSVGSASQGASLAALANLEENSPKLRCCDLFSIRPWVATSQNAVEPPLPRITS
ncbi:hypothetical protein STENM327S_08458 [Streptomyces tendae]